MSDAHKALVRLHQAGIPLTPELLELLIARHSLPRPTPQSPPGPVVNTVDKTSHAVHDDLFFSQAMSLALQHLPQMPNVIALCRRHASPAVRSAAQAVAPYLHLLTSPAVMPAALLAVALVVAALAEVVRSALQSLVMAAAVAVLAPGMMAALAAPPDEQTKYRAHDNNAPRNASGLMCVRRLPVSALIGLLGASCMFTSVAVTVVLAGMYSMWVAGGAEGAVSPGTENIIQDEQDDNEGPSDEAQRLFDGLFRHRSLW